MAGLMVLDQAHSERWSVYNADTVDVARAVPDNSVGLSVFSPPFEGMYTYSASPRDMGNCTNRSTFAEHYRYLVAEQFRAMMPGRLVCVHCMLLPTVKWKDGYIGLQDFRGDLIRMYQETGFILHSEVTIWKDPVTQMQRTHHIGLLHKQVKQDSAKSRQGLADYVVVMLKPGENPRPIAHVDDALASTVDDKPLVWQRYASPVWDDIDPGDTLQRARDEEDERHIAPLQLGVIRRCVQLWSNPGDVVWTPFMGIGSEVVVAVQEGRYGIGAELKPTYFQQAVANIRAHTSQTSFLRSV